MLTGVTQFGSYLIKYPAQKARGRERDVGLGGGVDWAFVGEAIEHTLALGCSFRMASRLSICVTLVRVSDDRFVTTPSRREENCCFFLPKMIPGSMDV